MTQGRGPGLQKRAKVNALVEHGTQIEAVFRKALSGYLLEEGPT
ncbi:hypothetical protein [Mesorhizobium hawassense]|nr:hypothetical protein [Mesorhizobium hawassense]